MTFATLQALLHLQIEELDRTVALCLARLERRQEFAQAGTEDILADSLASCLHSFYTGLENLLETIALELDELPQGPQWHKRLLSIMTIEVPGIRPPVLTRESQEMLDDFRAFRHLFRNLYTHNLRPERVFGLAQTLAVTWRLTKADLTHFLDILRNLDGKGKT